MEGQMDTWATTRDAPDDTMMMEGQGTGQRTGHGLGWYSETFVLYHYPDIPFHSLRMKVRFTIDK